MVIPSELATKCPTNVVSGFNFRCRCNVTGVDLTEITCGGTDVAKFDQPTGKILRQMKIKNIKY